MLNGVVTCYVLIQVRLFGWSNWRTYCWQIVTVVTVSVCMSNALKCVLSVFLVDCCCWRDRLELYWVEVSGVSFWCVEIRTGLVCCVDCWYACAIFGWKDLGDELLDNYSLACGLD